MPPGLQTNKQVLEMQSDRQVWETGTMYRHAGLHALRYAHKYENKTAHAHIHNEGKQNYKLPLRWIQFRAGTSPKPNSKHKSSYRSGIEGYRWEKCTCVLVCVRCVRDKKHNIIKHKDSRMRKRWSTIFSQKNRQQRKVRYRMEALYSQTQHNEMKI